MHLYRVHPLYIFSYVVPLFDRKCSGARRKTHNEKNVWAMNFEQRLPACSRSGDFFFKIKSFTLPFVSKLLNATIERAEQRNQRLMHIIAHIHIWLKPLTMYCRVNELLLIASVQFIQCILCHEILFHVRNFKSFQRMQKCTCFIRAANQWKCLNWPKLPSKKCGKC